MKVKELIEQLKQFNPETEIFTSITDHTDWTTTLELERDSIELEDELYGENVVDDFEDRFNDEGNYIGKPILLIKLDN